MLQNSILILLTNNHTYIVYVHKTVTLKIFKHIQLHLVPFMFIVHYLFIVNCMLTNAVYIIKFQWKVPEIPLCKNLFMIDRWITEKIIKVKNLAAILAVLCSIELLCIKEFYTIYLRMYENWICSSCFNFIVTVKDIVKYFQNNQASHIEAIL